MCSLTDNAYKIEFNEFNIRDMDSGVQLFHVAKDPNMPDIDPAMIPPELEDQVRCIQYDFGADFLQLRTIGTQLTFSIGPHEVPNFRMIERHYFRNYLIRSFDFTFGCAARPSACRRTLRGALASGRDFASLHMGLAYATHCPRDTSGDHTARTRKELREACPMLLTPLTPWPRTRCCHHPCACQSAASASPTRPTHGRPSTSSRSSSPSSWR
jgi:hypothetical protein